MILALSLLSKDFHMCMLCLILFLVGTRQFWRSGYQKSQQADHLSISKHNKWYKNIHKKNCNVYE